MFILQSFILIAAGFAFYAFAEWSVDSAQEKHWRDGLTKDVSGSYTRGLLFALAGVFLVGSGIVWIILNAVFYAWSLL